MKMDLPARHRRRRLGIEPETIELPTPLKVPPPQGKSLWMMCFGHWVARDLRGMMVVSFASGSRSFTGAGSFFRS